MINHVRTVLSNRSGVTALPGEEIIDPTFSAIVIPVEYKSLYDVIFNSNSPVADQNTRMAVFLSIMHSPDTAKFASIPDPRITYLRASNRINPNPDAFEQSFDISRYIVLLASEINKMMGKGVDLFQETGQYASSMAELRNIWNQGQSDYERFSSVLYALAFRLDDARVGRASG
jgi:hypothetical protein